MKFNPAKIISNCIVLALVSTAAHNLAHAQTTYYWVGKDWTSGSAFGAYWNYNNNWSTSSGGSGLGSPIPSLQNFLNFDGSAATPANGLYNVTNNFAAGSGGYQIYFKSTAPAYNLYGNSITFYDFGGADPNIQNEGTANTQTINFPIVNGNTHGANGILNINLNGTTAQGPLTFNGGISAASGGPTPRAINVSGTNSVTFNGVISDGGNQISLTQLGTGTTTLNAANTFSGALTISAGTVAIGPNGLLGNGTYSTAISDTGTLIVGANNNQTLSGVISGTGGKLTKNGTGTLTLNGTAVNTYTGASTVNAGTLIADFSNISPSSTANLINSGSALTLGGGTLQIKGNASSASSQTFASTALNAGGSVISAAPASGVNYPTVALTAITANTGGSIVFNGPATINGSGNVAATGTITTTTAGQGPTTAGLNGLLGTGANNNAYATVGLYDWASTDLAAGTAGSSPYTIIGGSQVTGFYSSPAVNANLVANANNDLTVQETPSFGSTTAVRISSSTGTPAATVRFNSGHCPYVTSKNGLYFATIGGILVTPNMGTINAGFDGQLRMSAGACQIVQNNTSAVFCLGLNGDADFFANNSSTAEACIISGPGAVFLNPGSPMQIPFKYLNSGGTVTASSTIYYDSTQVGSSTWGAFYINGGVTVINNANVFGNPTGTQPTTAGGGGTVNLNGGTLMAATTTANAGSVSLINSASTGSASRPVFLGAAGGGLASQASTTFTVGGVIGNFGSVGGPLSIGIPASSANGSVVGRVPGTGGSTLNPAFNATGTVALTGPNTYTGGTILQSGTVQINGINNLGGSGTYGGLTFNGGTLLYASGASGAGSLDLSSGSSMTLASGGGTLDVNGNSITYAGSIGNSGSGALTVKSTAANGSLTLSGANTYTGGTTLSSGTLIVNNSTGSGTGSGTVTLNGGTLKASGIISGNVAVNSGATLGGTGTIGGLVTNYSGGIIAPGSSVGTLTVGSLTMNFGSTNNFEFNSTPTNDLIVVTTSGGLTISGGTFNLYSEGTTSQWLPAATTTYNLIQFSGTAPSLDSTWTTDSSSNPHIANPASGYTYQFGISGGYLTLKVTVAAILGSWNVDGSGSWTTTGNWLGGSVPGANSGTSGDTATFAGVSQSAAHSVTLNANESLGGITMNQAQSFTIADGGNGKTLTLDNKTAGASVSVTAGTANAIQTGVALNDNASVSVSSGKSLAISGVVSNATGVTKTLTFNGAGTNILSAANTYGPSAGTVGTTLSGGGTLQVGNNTALGAGDLSVAASGVLQAGASVSLANNVTVGSATMTVDTAGNALALNGVVGGSGGALTKIGSGTLTLGNANTYFNNTAINAGTMKLGVANAIPNGGSTTGWLVLDGGASVAGTFDLNGYNQTVNALSGNTGTVLGQIVNNSGSGTSTLTVSGGNTTGFAGNIQDNNNSTSGKVAVILGGTTALTLSGANTYSGGTTLGSGTTLKLGGTSAIGTSTLTINGGTLDSTVASLVNSGNNAQNWNADFTFTGTQSLDLGSGTATMVGGTRTVTVSANTLTVGPISDGGNNYGLTKAGSGTLALNGQSTFNGTITMNGGPILVKNSNGLGYGTVQRSSSVVQLASGVNVTNSLNCPGTDTTDLMIDCPSGAATWSGPLSASGSGGMRLGTTGGTLTLTGPGSFGSRGLIFTYGTVVLAGGANFSVSGGTVGIGRDGNGSGRACSLTLKDTASLTTPANGFDVTKATGPITFTIQDSASFSCGANTFDLHNGGTSANTINLNGGTMTVGSFIKSDTTSAATLNLNGGTLKAGAAGTNLPALAALTVNVGTGGAIVNDNGFAVTIAQPLLGAAGDGGLTKQGGGTLTLASANTYTGNTAISGGTLLVNNATGSGTGSGAVTVVSGAKLGGTGTISGAVTVNSGGSIAPGVGIGTLTLNAAPIFNGTALMEINSTNAQTADKVVLSTGTLTYGGTLTVTNLGTVPANGTIFTLFNAPSYAGSFSAVNLPPGGTTHWNTGNLTVDGTLQFTNSTPVAGDSFTMGVVIGTPSTVQIMSGKHSPSDADGDVLTITSVTGATNGTVTFTGTNLTYTATNGTTDSFTYTVSDSFGGTASTVVSANISPAGEGFNRLSPPSPIGNGSVVLSYLGVPGYNYALDWATNLAAPINWTAVSTNKADEQGALNFTNTSAAPANYFRTRYVP